MAAEDAVAAAVDRLDSLACFRSAAVVSWEVGLSSGGRMHRSSPAVTASRDYVVCVVYICGKSTLRGTFRSFMCVGYIRSLS